MRAGTSRRVQAIEIWSLETIRFARKRIHAAGENDYIDPDASLASLPIVPLFGAVASVNFIRSVSAVTSSNRVHTLRFSGRPIGNIDRASPQHSSGPGGEGVGVAEGEGVREKGERVRDGAKRGQVGQYFREKRFALACRPRRGECNKATKDKLSN